MAGAVQVDDNDSSIVYSGQWIISLGNKNEYNLTAHGTFENGSTVTFSFFGTSVMWFGTIPGGLTGPSSAVAFAVDGDQASSKTAILPMSLPKSVITSHLWYSSPILSNGPHTVVATVLNAQPEIPLWIDYLNYTSSGLPVDVPNAPYSGTTSSASVVPETSEAPSPAISMTPSPIASPAQVPQGTRPGTSAPSHHSAVHLNTVIPAVLIPLTALIVLLAAVLRLRRARRGRGGNTMRGIGPPPFVNIERPSGDTNRNDCGHDNPESPTICAEAGSARGESASAGDVRSVPARVPPRIIQIGNQSLLKTG